MCSSRCTLALILVFSSLLSCQDKSVQPSADAGLGDAGSPSDSGPLDGGECHNGGCDCSLQPCADGFICGDDHECEKAPTCKAIVEDCEVDVDCCQGSDATKGAWCNEEGRCAECAVIGAGCQSDYDCCPGTVTSICTYQKVCRPACEVEADCAASEVCMPGGECLPTPCSSDTQCPGQKCCSGVCKDDCGYGAPTACAVTTPGGVIFPNRKFRLQAIAWTGEARHGAQIIPWTQFTWASSNNPAVTVDPATGELSGGMEQGSAAISARTGGLDCGQVIVTNHLPAPAGSIRVLVYDEETGNPVEDADVVIGSNTPVKTDSAGMASLASPPADVHVFHPGYVWISLVGLGLDDYVVNLKPKPDEVAAGGYRGSFDFSNEPRGFQFGRACMSYKGDLMNSPLEMSGNPLLFFLDIAPETRCDERIVTHIKWRTSEGAPTDFEDWLPTPGGFMASAVQFGAPEFIPSYRVLGGRGLKTAWAIGGGLPSKDLMMIIQIITMHPDPLVSVRSEPVPGAFGVMMLRFLQNLGHAVSSVFEVVPVPKIPTPLAENGEPLVDAPTIADYASFPEVDFTPANRFTLKTVITLPRLPTIQGRCLSGLYVEGEALMPGLGAITLGKNAALANRDDTRLPGDCVVDKPDDNVDGNPEGIIDGQITLRMSPNHDGTETSPYRTVLLASEFNRAFAHDTADVYGLAFNATIGGRTAAVSGRILRADVVERTLDLTSQKFMPFPEGAIFDSSARTIQAPPAVVDGAVAYRYTISNAHGEWQVYTDIDTTAITLPSPPPGHDDWAAGAGMTVNAFATRGVLLGELVSSAVGSHLNDLGDLVDAFSRLTCLKKIPTDDPDYATKCQPTDPTQVDEACNPACELR